MRTRDGVLSFSGIHDVSTCIDQATFLFTLRMIFGTHMHVKPDVPFVVHKFKLLEIQ